LLWEAGRSGLRAKLERRLILELISTRFEKIFGLDGVDDYVFFENDPLEYGARTAVIVEGGQISKCFPKQLGEVIAKA
jgi:hypothetical protein